MADDKKIIFSMVGVSKTFPPQKQVLKNIYLSFFYGAKIGIIGLNGSGKSTLLKIIAGIEKSYQGDVVFSPGYTVGYLEQEPRLDPEKTVKEIVQEGVQPILDLLAEYEAVNLKFGDPEILEDPDKMDALMNRQAELQDKIDATDAWNLDNKLERAMDALRCPPEDQLVKYLSGGERRRVALCRLLLQQPDILLLDEPTNHLDAESIDWLEQHLQQYAGTVIAITHDRYFLDRTVDRIAAFEEERIVIYEGDYTEYQEKSGKIETDAIESVDSGAGLHIKKNNEKKKEGREKWLASKNKEKLLKFTYKEQKEFETIDDDIAKLEEKIEQLDEEIMENATNSGKLAELTQQKEETEEALNEKMDRWVYLNDLAEQIANQ